MVPPCETKVSSNAANTSCTIGPCSAKPVSRQASMPLAGLPSHAAEMHKPLTKAVCSSIISDLRWLREKRPMPAVQAGGL